MWLEAYFNIFHLEGEGKNIRVKIIKLSKINRLKESDLIKSIQKTAIN